VSGEIEPMSEAEWEKLCAEVDELYASLAGELDALVEEALALPPPDLEATGAALVALAMDDLCGMSIAARRANAITPESAQPDVSPGLAWSPTSQFVSA